MPPTCKDCNEKFESTGLAGFSLVELMISVAIIGILAAIAIPTYRNYVSTARKVSMEGVLLQIPILLEQYRAESNTGSPCPGGSPCNATYTYDVGTDTEVDGISGWLPSFVPGKRESGASYTFTVNVITDDNATLTATVTRGGTVSTYTCFYPSGTCL